VQDSNSVTAYVGQMRMWIIYVYDAIRTLTWTVNLGVVNLI